jgi:hypothetical protein
LIQPPPKKPAKSPLVKIVIAISYIWLIEITCQVLPI